MTYIAIEIEVDGSGEQAIQDIKRLISEHSGYKVTSTCTTYEEDEDDTLH